MHYYQFNIGDYAAHTRHLSLLEDLAYRRLLDLYYSSEKPLIIDTKKLARLLSMPSNEPEIKQVLEDFFILSVDGYIQNRVNEEIAKYHSKADSARANGKKGGRPKKPKGNPEETQSVNSANPEESGSKAKQETGTIKHETENNKQDYEIVFEFWKEVMKKNARTNLSKDRASKIKARLKEGYSVDEIKNAVTNCSMDEWHMSNGVSDIEYICRNQQHLDKFLDKKPTQKAIQQDDTSWANNMQPAYLPNQQKALGHE